MKRSWEEIYREVPMMCWRAKVPRRMVCRRGEEAGAFFATLTRNTSGMGAPSHNGMLTRMLEQRAKLTRYESFLDVERPGGVEVHGATWGGSAPRPRGAGQGLPAREVFGGRSRRPWWTPPEKMALFRNFR